MGAVGQEVAKTWRRGVLGFWHTQGHNGREINKMTVRYGHKQGPNTGWGRPEGLSNKWQNTSLPETGSDRFQGEVTFELYGIWAEDHQVQRSV